MDNPDHNKAKSIVKSGLFRGRLSKAQCGWLLGYITQNEKAPENKGHK